MRLYFLFDAFHTLSLLYFPLLHFPSLLSTPAFSTPAFSALLSMTLEVVHRHEKLAPKSDIEFRPMVPISGAGF